MSSPKVLFLGSGGVGKTNIIYQLLCSSFHDRYWPSVLDHCVGYLRVRRRATEVEIIDTSGLFPNSLSRRLMIARSRVVVIVYAVDNRASFYNVASVLREVAEAKQAKSHQNLPVVVLGNKSDLVDREVGRAEAAVVAKYEWSVAHYEVSALEGWNIERPIIKALERATDRHSNARRWSTVM
ncbi:GTP-binding protein Rhes-like [Ptychodera flava]|uniref:GTP-binding protein Rhes-like n=1 Tax=Ptychodera flava TaxID=63121 RepID=UPI00396A62A9